VNSGQDGSYYICGEVQPGHAQVSGSTGINGNGVMDSAKPGIARVHPDPDAGQPTTPAHGWSDARHRTYTGHRAVRRPGRPPDTTTHTGAPRPHAHVDMDAVLP